MLQFCLVAGFGGVPFTSPEKPAPAAHCATVAYPHPTVAKAMPVMCRCHLKPGFKGPCCCVTGKKGKTGGATGKMLCARCGTDPEDSVVVIFGWHSMLPDSRLILSLPHLAAVVRCAAASEHPLSFAALPPLPPPRS